MPNSMPTAGNPFQASTMLMMPVDCTRKPDWEVVKPSELPPEPDLVNSTTISTGMNAVWMKKFRKKTQTKIIEQEAEDFNKAAERGEDPSRYFQNEVLDPYYQSGSDPSEPPSAGHSLDSFI